VTNDRAATMTDGERLVWAAAFALAVEQHDDGCSAVKIATLTVQKLRTVADAPKGTVHFTADENAMLDEIARVP